MKNAWAAIAEYTQQPHANLLAACSNMRKSQDALLLELLKCAEGTGIAKTLGFNEIIQSESLVKRFQEIVPIQNYDAIESAMQQQMAGVDALVAENVEFYERTGGSSGCAKYIPYTHRALHLLQSAVEPWLHNLIQNRPAIVEGPAYWSVSPALNLSERTTDNTAIGATSDLAFMRNELQIPFAQTLVDMSAIGLATDYQQWQKYTLLTLLMHENLKLISIWSPTFLTSLLTAFNVHQQWLLAALANPAAYDLGTCEFLLDRLRNQAAVTRFKAAIRAHPDSSGSMTSILWPQLDTISCWTHGPANGAFKELRRWFPHTHFQPKGLLATEGVVSIPLYNASYPVLALGSGFFEFVDDSDNVFLPEALVVGKCYRVLITNASGLYRYDIGDQVRVQGFYRQTPMIEFIGRSSSTSDLVGEKLHEAFVTRCLEGMDASCVLVPRNDHYCLYVDRAVCVEKAADELMGSMAIKIEEQLCNNPQYRYARELGQLSAIQVRLVTGLATEQMNWQHSQGQVVGDIKPVSLCKNAKLITHLDRLFLEQSHAAPSKIVDGSER